jgi:hypothetical protein
MWLSADPAMGEYVPLAPIDDEAKQHNKELPGMGGVFNYVNLHAYHYAGNNPVKYTDPDGAVFKIKGGLIYKVRVMLALFRIERALKKSGDEIALKQFQDIKQNENYIVEITKPNKGDGNSYSRLNYINEKNEAVEGKISYDPNIKKGGRDRLGVSDRPNFVGLGHEIGHGIDEKIDPIQYEERRKPSTASPGFPNDVERFAVDFENSIRKGYNSNPDFQRPKY